MSLLNTANVLHIPPINYVCSLLISGGSFLEKTTSNFVLGGGEGPRSSWSRGFPLGKDTAAKLPCPSTSKKNLSPRQARGTPGSGLAPLGACSSPGAMRWEGEMLPGLRSILQRCHRTLRGFPRPPPALGSRPDRKGSPGRVGGLGGGM